MPVKIVKLVLFLLHSAPVLSYGSASFAHGFQLAPSNSLEGIGLSRTCEDVLYQSINCESTVHGLGTKTYHTGLGSNELMAEVCNSRCETALRTARRRIAGACKSSPNIMPGYPVLSMIDEVYTGWNETCLRDKTSSKYCNGVILNDLI